MILIQGGPSAAFLGLLVFVGRLVYTGKLVPRSAVEDIKENFKQQINREREISESWHTVVTNNAGALQKMADQNEKLLEGQKTVEAIISSIPRATLQITSGLSGSRVE
jgi:hypothetical protein